MFQFKNYINTDAVAVLCRQINMPDEVTIQITDIISNCDFTPITDAFNKLFDIAVGNEAFESIEAFCKKEHNGLKSLAVYLMAALHTKELYEEKGIDTKIYIETMIMFTRFVNEYKNSYGIYGFDRGFWVYRILAINLFRIGELEYEMYRMWQGIEGHFITGEYVLYVHIPSDAILTRENLDKSYHMAGEFFKKFFKEFKYKCFYTHTWLLSKELKKLLPETSKILLFQSDYEIISIDEEDTSFMRWVYKRKYEDLHELTENTSLERNIKKHLLAGGKIGSGAGMFEKK